MKHPFQTGSERFNLDLVEILPSECVHIDLRYNGINNFMKVDLYKGFNKAYLHAFAFEKFQVSIKTLKKEFPEYRFVIFDALRPRSVQRLMRDFVAGSSQQDYVADPELGSLHNFGMAIDLSLELKTGKPVDMGTEFDDFSELAQPKLEESLLAQSKLSRDQIENRRVLKSLMESADFEQLPHEWWHFNALPADQVRGKFQIFE